MNKTKLLNLLQIRKVEIENDVDAEDDQEKFTQFLINFAKNGESATMRKVFQANDGFLDELLKRQTVFTKKELTEVLKKLRLY